jgi:hypothetical protein
MAMNSSGTVPRMVAQRSRVMESFRTVLECEDGGNLAGDEEDRVLRGGPVLVVKSRSESSRMSMRIDAARFTN